MLQVVLPEVSYLEDDQVIKKVGKNWKNKKMIKKGKWEGGIKIVQK